MDTRKKPTPIWLGVLIVIGGIVLLGAILGGEPETPLEKAEREAAVTAERYQDACTDRVMAFVMSQEFVRRELRAPRTARFPMITNDQVTSVSTGPCTFRVRAFVDAENGFGGEVRTFYTAEVQAQPDDSWRIVSGPTFD